MPQERNVSQTSNGLWIRNESFLNICNSKKPLNVNTEKYKTVFNFLYSAFIMFFFSLSCLFTFTAHTRYLLELRTKWGRELYQNFIYESGFILVHAEFINKFFQCSLLWKAQYLSLSYELCLSFSSFSEFRDVYHNWTWDQS